MKVARQQKEIMVFVLGNMKNNGLRETAAGKFSLVIRQTLPMGRRALEIHCHKCLLTENFCQNWSVPILLADTKVD